MLFDHFLARGLRLSHLVNEPLNRGLHLPQLLLGRGQLFFKLRDSLLQCPDLARELLLDIFLAVKSTFMSLLKFSNSVCVVLLLLG